MNKLFGPLLAVGLIALIAFFALTDSSAGDLEANFVGEITDIQESDHQSGSGDVEIIEYGDFECPVCGAFYPVADKVKEELSQDTNLAFRHLPITSLHPNAMAAHRASEAAAIQGKFFEMHDLLYENQSEWSRVSAPSITAALEIIEGYAEELDLDMDQYRADVEGEAVRKGIQVDSDSASKIGAKGTPTVYVNGEKINAPIPRPEIGYTVDQAYEDMKTIIENAKAGRPLTDPADDTEQLQSAESDEEETDSTESN